MSVKGIYTALSGAMAQSQKLDTISNNIANANTPSFKRDDVVFQEYLTANEKEQEFMNIPKVPGTLDSFYHMQGGDKSFVDTKGTYTDFSQGSMKSTGNTLDVAIDGKGFFEVVTPQGVKLTRSGNFTLDGGGQLVTKDGYPVLAAGEGDPSARIIKFTAVGTIGIGDDGKVTQGEVPVSQLSVVNVKNPDSLVKTGQNLYGFKPNMKAEVENMTNPSLKQGFLEMSNVNIVKEMTDMISAHRVFESTQKAISAYDGMTDKLVNVVGKTN